MDSGTGEAKCSRIEIAVRPDRDDPFAAHAAWEIGSTLGYEISSLRTVSVYTVYSRLSKERLSEFARDVLCDPVLCIYTVDAPAALKLPFFRWAVEVGYKPGVTDNVGHTATDVLKMMMKNGEQRPGPSDAGDGSLPAVYKSVQYLIDAELERKSVERIGREILYNGLIEEIVILDRNEFEERGGVGPRSKNSFFDHAPVVDTLDLHVPDDALMELSADRVLALTLEEMKYFRNYFDREAVRQARIDAGIGPDPTDVELECFAQTQSEHCKHKIFNASIRYRENGRERVINSLFKTFICSATERIAKEKDFLVSVFSDNAGVVRFNDDYNLVFKVETHNSPSALDPYGGAITGIVGCDRDPAGTGMGSRIIAHTDVLCFGDPFVSVDELPPRMMHPKRIMEGVVKGIEDGGNKCGIPTVNGAVLFDPSYRGKPLVFCGSVGIMPRFIDGMPAHEKHAKPGDVIVMAGGRIGKDGIHGATFSSEEISEKSPSQAVQIGDPITQKNLLDMILEARDRFLYRGITDNGAGGLSSSVGEMALLAGGAVLQLEKAPLKYAGLDPWEILLSEAQERMTLAVPEEKLNRFLELAESRDVLAVSIGRFTDSGYFHIRYGNRTVGLLELEFLHASIPLSLEAVWEEPPVHAKPPSGAGDLGEVFLRMIGDLNICSREPVIRRYDHEVGGNTVIKPLMGWTGKEKGKTAPSDGGVIAPVPGDHTGFVLASGINPFLSPVDTYTMGAHAVDEALRNAVSVGADPDRVALLDNFCWPDPVYNEEKTPDGRYKLAQLVRAAKALHDAATAYGAPFISGKDSMKNDYKIGEHKVSVLPTVLVSALGIVPDIRTCVTSDFKLPGDGIYLLGETGPALGCSLFYRLYGGSSHRLPEVDFTRNGAVYRFYFGLVRDGVIASGHDLSEGGLAVGLMESCIGGMLGSDVDISSVEERSGLSPEEVLFSESAGRFLVSVSGDRESDLERRAGAAGLSHLLVRIGKTGEGNDLRVKAKRGDLLSLSVESIASSYRRPLYDLMGMAFDDGPEGG